MLDTWYGPEVAGVTFSVSDPVSNFWIRIGKFSKFENPTTVQTLATIDPTEIYPCFTWEMATQTPASAEIEKWLRIRAEADPGGGGDWDDRPS